jgi:NAD-dependent SIR2 family protein deacetylase
MGEISKTVCVGCHEELDESNVELRIAGIGPVCPQCADEYETAFWGDLKQLFLRTPMNLKIR